MSRSEPDDRFTIPGRGHALVFDSGRREVATHVAFWIRTKPEVSQ